MLWILTQLVSWAFSSVIPLIAGIIFAHARHIGLVSTSEEFGNNVILDLNYGGKA